MSSNRPTNSHDPGESSNAHQQVPSWDEFNVVHEEDPVNGGGEMIEGNEGRLSNASDLDADQNDLIGERVGGQEEEETINEPGQPEEFGPSLPQGFGGDESQDGAEQQPGGSDLLNDFSIPIEHYDLDDPEDPLQCSSSSLASSSMGHHNNPRRDQHTIGPQLPSSSSFSPMLPRINVQRADEHLLPSIGCVKGNNNSGGGGNALVHSSDFIPTGGDPTGGHPSQPTEMAPIGPALPPDLLIPGASSNSNGPLMSAAFCPSSLSDQQPRTSFPNMDGLDDLIVGTSTASTTTANSTMMMMMMPPDEPQCSYSSRGGGGAGGGSRDCQPQQQGPRRAHQGQRHAGSQDRHIGPTLPSESEDEEDDEEGEDAGEDDEKEGERKNGTGKMHRNGQKRGPGRAEERDGGGEGEAEEVEEEEMMMMIGPMPPAPGRSEEEEQAEYMARLAQFEANKAAKVSNGVKREEWMTELPQKMLKTGAFGLSAKTSFSRSAGGDSASTSAAAAAAWTSVPNGGGGRNNTNGQGPSTSSALSSSQNAANPPPKRSQQDEAEEHRAQILQKGRNESLMDMHQKKRKIADPTAAAASSSLLKTNTGERRPFNRDTDIDVRLGAKGSNPATLKERMGELSNRFGHSSEKKYL